MKIHTDQTPLDAAGDYEVGDATLHYRTPTGSEQSRFRQLSAQLRDARQDHIDGAPEPTDEQVDHLQDQADDEVDGDEARRRLKLATFVPPEDLRRDYLRLARDITVGLSGVEVPTDEGVEPLDWSDDEQLRGLFVGARDADTARATVLDRLGESGPDAENLVYDYVSHVFADEALDEEEQGN